MCAITTVCKCKGSNLFANGKRLEGVSCRFFTHSVRSARRIPRTPPLRLSYTIYPAFCAERPAGTPYRPLKALKGALKGGGRIG